MLVKKICLIVFLVSIPINVIAQNETKITFSQNDKKLPIKNDNIVTLKKQPFSIIIPNKKYNEKNNLFYSTQVAILENKFDLSIIEPGNLIESISFFQNGSGYATDKDNKYSTIQIGTEGHHYIYYSNATNNRINLLSQLRNEYIGEWSITSFYDTSTDTTKKMQKLKQKVLYFVVFRNMNLDKIIDENEVEIYTLRFF